MADDESGAGAGGGDAGGGDASGGRGDVSGGSGDASGGRGDASGGRGANGAGGGGADAGGGGAERLSPWARFKHTAFFPATVIVLLISAGAGLFAGSYTFAFANPTPRNIPTAVVITDDDAALRNRFLTGMEKALNASLRLHPYPSFAKARWSLEEQRVFAILRARDHGLELDVAGAAGATVAQVLSQAGGKVGRASGVPVTVRDLKPLQPGDPRGLAVFYISLAATIIGFLGAIQLSVNAAELNPAERIAFNLAYALLGAFSIAAIVDWGLKSLRLPFAESWAILALTMFTSGLVFSMFNVLFGRWALLPTWGLMVILGNPSSGGAVSWPLLPSLLGTVGRWLPPGASVNAQHTAIYFPRHQHPFPFLVLGGWCLLSAVVFWTWRHRHPGGRPPRATPTRC
ncbi:ABC transporter permease [Streptomyces sp. NEAU-YJ-81]|uniref:ABC transporter permease n=1 Tax=Streptomyces sp. NEAU-YJ-81 TaxID=2820288 RepID=UPI001ABCBE26|nr:ABC transporter permease [Streptomyces sp. NEAU-YJ-81]MBO3673486.1 ABC transporter permease [Streptomyces sp. NEAU-YJ-81]